MKRMIGIAALALLVAWVTAAPSHAQERAAAAVEKASHIVVLKSGKAENRPNFAGAKVVFEHRLWVVIDAPEAAVEGLRRNPNIKFIQRIVPPEEAEAVRQGRSTGQVEANAAPGFDGAARRIEPASEPANWNSGTYAYDGAGNITAIGADLYGYDWLGRLSRASFRAGTTQLTERYEYDDFGNLTNRSGAPLSLPSALAVEWQTNRLAASTGAQYDGAGNLTRWWEYRYEHDPAGMLRESSVMHEWNYIYDANDERIGVRDNGVGSWQWTIRNVNGQVLRRYESQGGTDHTGYWLWVEDTVYRGSQLLGAEREAAEGGRLHYHLDHLGTPRQITNALGEQLSRHDYYPHGIEATSTRQMQVRNYEPNQRQYTGHERDYGSGVWSSNVDYVDYMHARYYSPVMGRFLSVDPVMDLKAAMANPQRWNRYSYVSNNPINKVDPDGRDEWAMEQRLGGYSDDWSGRDKQQAGVLIATVSLLTPGPEDLLVGAVVGKIGGFVGRLLGKADDVGEFAAKASRYDDITRAGSVENRATNVTRADFGKNLERQGFTKSVSKDGKVTIYKKDGVKYTIRDTSKSRGPTAEVFKDGKLMKKVRLEEDPR